MKITIARGNSWINGTATSPQLSPAITVLKIKRLAFMTWLQKQGSVLQQCQTFTLQAGKSASTQSLLQRILSGIVWQSGHRVQ